jgi:hypothetical protein
MVSAAKMAMRLRQLSGLLQDEYLIESDSVTAIEKTAVMLDRQKQKFDWSYSITPTDPIRFCPVDTKKANFVQPSLQVTLGMANEHQGGFRGSFSELNTTLEFHSKGQLLDRWHVDLANDGQAGPLFHLQHGGHSSGSTTRHTEKLLSVPRWMYPPMDIVLACELIVANFFEEKWIRLRRDPKWVALVRETESFCYTDYFNTLSAEHSNPHRKETMLQTLWVT